MPERSAPFEDGPPVSSAPPVVHPSLGGGGAPTRLAGGSAGESVIDGPQGAAGLEPEGEASGKPQGPASGSPQPGSPEEAAVLSLVFGEGASSSPARADRRRRNLTVMSAFIAVAAVVGLILGASYLRHVAATTSGTTPSGSVSTHSESERSVLASATSAATYESSHTLTLAGLTASLATAEPSLSFPLVSGGATQVSVAIPTPGAVVLTSFQPSPAACVGVLQVVSAQSAPIFSADPATADVGTYYFEAPASSGLCNAVVMTPPDGDDVSAQGFPTATLP